MSLAENLLNSLSEENEISTMIANVNEEEHIIVNGNRTIIVPNSLKTIATTGERNVETVTFDCVRYWDGHDLSTFSIYLNYTLPNGVDGTYNAKDIKVYDEYYSFDWTIDETFTKKEGKIKISLLAKVVEDNIILQQWGSFINEDITVAPTLPVSIVEDPELDATEAKNNAERAALSASEARIYAEIAEKAAKKSEESASQVLPKVTSNDDGKILVVEDGEWAVDFPPTGSGTDANLAAIVSNHESRIKALENTISDALYKEIAITSFTNNKATVEIGSVVTAVTFSWTLNKTPEVISLNNISQTASASGGTTLSGLNLTSNTTYTLQALDEKGTMATATTSINFFNGIYHGVGATFDNFAFTKTLSDTKGRTFTVTAGEGQYIWYAVPSRLGTCSFNVGGFDGGFSLVDITSVTNSSGYSEEYYIYRSDNANLGDTTVKVS